jgi:hypothetical protein
MYSSTVRYTHHPCEPSTAVLPLKVREDIVYEDIVGLASLARTSSYDEDGIEGYADGSRPVVEEFLVSIVVQLLADVKKEVPRIEKALDTLQERASSHNSRHYFSGIQLSPSQKCLRLVCCVS